MEMYIRFGGFRVEGFGVSGLKVLGFGGLRVLDLGL